MGGWVVTDQNLMLAQGQVFCPGQGPGPNWHLTWTGPGPDLGPGMGPGIGPGPELDNCSFLCRNTLITHHGLSEVVWLLLLSTKDQSLTYDLLLLARR